MYGTRRQFQFGIDARTTLATKPKIIRELGKADLIGRNSIGFEGGISLKYVINKNLSLNTGIYAGTLPFGYKFELKTSDFQNTLGINFFEKGTFYYTTYSYLPFNIEYFFLHKNRLKYALLAGFNMRKYPNGYAQLGYHVQDSSSYLHEILSVYLDINIPKHIRANYQIGGCAYIKLKHLNDLKISLLHNFSFDDVAKGYYRFFRYTNEYTYGSFSVSGSYTAFSVGYILTGERKFSREKIKTKASEVKIIK